MSDARPLDDDHLAELSREWHETVVRHRALARSLIGKAAARLVGDPTKGVTALDPNELDINDITRLVQTALAAERPDLGAISKLELRLANLEHFRRLRDLTRHPAEPETPKKRQLETPTSKKRRARP